jgi:hypothetical protein
LQLAERKLADYLRRHANGANPKGVFECDERTVTGSYSTGRLRRTEHTVTDLLADDVPGSADDDLFVLLRQLFETSKSEPLGPFYRVDIRIDGNDVGFEYYWQGTPVSSLAELAPPVSGKTPRFLFGTRFDAEFIAFVDDAELDIALTAWVESRLDNEQAVSEPLLDMYAAMNWHYAIVSSGFMEHYSRLDEPPVRLTAAEWYERTARALRDMRQEEPLELLMLAVGLYSSLYGAVENVRLALGAEKVSEIDESELYDRYFKFETSLRRAMTEEVRMNPSRYAVPLAQGAQ